MSDLVVSIAEIGLVDLPLVGGKGASLGEMVHLGLPVPPGCVVTTKAFLDALTEIDPAGSRTATIERLDPLDRAAVERATSPLRAAIADCALPSALESELLEHYRRLGDGRPTDRGQSPVAVRSSATGEDSLDASFAGLQDTFLWVRGEDALLERLRACWASLYSVESVCYRLQRGISEEGAAMAVVVQVMVEARSAGVMFTRSPSTGDRSVVAVESAWGLGSAVVGGEVTPDSFTVSKVTGEILRRRVSEKLLRHIPDGAQGGRVVEVEVPPELRSVASLTDEELSDLVALGQTIEAHYGVPQDVEWALAVDRSQGKGLYLLQSRPETAWSNRTTEPIAAPKSRAFDHVIEALGGA
ncbi:MAG: PEP/pyruvate-binding domain-containing protein [Acidimicrobiales bacterium]